MQIYRLPLPHLAWPGTAEAVAAGCACPGSTRDPATDDPVAGLTAAGVWVAGVLHYLYDTACAYHGPTLERRFGADELADETGGVRWAEPGEEPQHYVVPTRMPEGWDR